MRGTVRIGQYDVDMLANGASPFIYKRIFKKDFFTAIGDAKNVDIDTVTEMAYVMHLQTEKTFKDILDTVTISDFYEWIAGFEALDFPMASSKIMGIYYDNQKGTATPKKK
jgi:hypothetical protein